MWNVVETPAPIKFYPVETPEGTKFRRIGGLMIRGTMRHDLSPLDQIWRVVYCNRAGKGTFSITAPDRKIDRLNHRLDWVKVSAKANCFQRGSNRKGGMTPTQFQRELAEMCGGNFAGSFYGMMVDAVKVALEGAE